MAKASKKSLVIDSVSLLSPFSGIARYTYENAKLIQKSNLFNLYFNYLYPSRKLLQNTTTNNTPKSIRNFLVSNRYLKTYSRKLINSINILFPKIYDIYWQPNIIPNPYIKSKKLILTLHDFSFLLYPESHPKERLKYIEKNLQKSVDRADHIITGSNYTKSEIVKYLHVEEEKITVIYHAIDHSLFKEYPKEQLQKSAKKMNLPKKFLLFLGSIEPRKNLLNLLRAYNDIDISTQQEYPLVIAGAKGWKNTKILQEIQNSKHIKYLGYIEDSLLPHLYNLATIFIYPSLYEGFGIPPLEAMACSTPVITSDTSSIPEICKDAVLYIDPLNPQDIKQKILSLLKDKNLQLSLKSKGRQRAKKFTWDKSAQKHIEVFSWWSNNYDK